MMHYKKYFLFIVVTFLSFFVLSSIASAGGSCFATGPTTAAFQLTGCPNPGHGALYFVDSPFWWSYTIKSSYAFCNSSGVASGLSPGTSYNFSGFDSNNLPRGSCSLSTPALPPPPPATGTVKVAPNIASATWTLTGPATNQSGTGSVTLNNKNTGIYSITWNNVVGYAKTTTTQSLSLTSGGTITFSNTYTLIFASLPTVNWPGASSITSTSAVLDATLSSDGGAPIVARGTCWGLTSVTVTTCAPEGGTALGLFSHLRTGMPPGTMIYHSGYATNSVGTGYSGIRTFVTLAGATVPTLTTLPATSITASSALLGAAFVSTGGAPITAKGICWGITTNPTTNCDNYGAGVGTGEFGSVRAGMPSGTLIYYRGYAINSAGTGYSPTMSFTTLSAPTIDLTAGTVAPSTAIAGVPTSLSATISNTGTLGTGTSFTSLFQFDNDIDHTTSVFASQNSPTPAISAGSTANTSASYAFPNTGTWYVRACADNDTAFVSTITETNEGNNCGAWTPVTVVATTGTLITPNCIISTGLSSCTSIVEWSISNPVVPNSVQQNGTSFSTAVSSAGTPRTLSYGSHTFTLHSNGTTLVTNTATASCTGGTSWNGSACAIPPVFSCTGATPLNATIYTGDTAGLVASTPKTYNTVNTATKCEFSCNTGFSWNGTNCVASVCGDGICNGTDTLLTCPKDCKGKVWQF